MDNESERIEYAARHTEIVRHPRQHLATFGVTNVYYYILSEPTYSELSNNGVETVIREGRVIAERPKIVTPYYLSHLEGFSYDARQYFQKLMMMHGPNAPGLYYTYKNEPKGLNIVSDNIFHTKMMLKNLKLENYLFGPESATLKKTERARVQALLKKEIQEIFECRNLFDRE